jgi:hypothetical protein
MSMPELRKQGGQGFGTSKAAWGNGGTGIRVNKLESFRFFFSFSWPMKGQPFDIYFEKRLDGTGPRIPKFFDLSEPNRKKIHCNKKNFPKPGRKFEDAEIVTY